jgi:hypothetical protein
MERRRRRVDFVLQARLEQDQEHEERDDHQADHRQHLDHAGLDEQRGGGKGRR